MQKTNRLSSYDNEVYCSNVNMKQKFPKNESEWINKEDLTSL